MAMTFELYMFTSFYVYNMRATYGINIYNEYKYQKDSLYILICYVNDATT